MTHPDRSWFLRSDDPDSTQSSSPGVEYHRVLAGEKRRIGRGLAAIALLGAGMVVLAVTLNALAAAADAALGRTGYTPLTHAAAMLSLAALIPWSMLIQRWLYQVPGPSLHSVTSRVRFGVLGRSLLVLAPFWALVITLGYLTPGDEVAWSHADLLAIFAISLVLTPLQAAGEEYGVRGLMFRVVGSWTRGPRAGLVLGVVVTAVVFAAIHGSGDPYILAWYLILFTCLAILTWRTGGLEVAVVLHAVLNTVTFLLAAILRTDIGGALDSRAEIAGSIHNLVPAAAILLITATVWWRTRHTGPSITPASATLPMPSPGAATMRHD